MQVDRLERVTLAVGGDPEDAREAFDQALTADNKPEPLSPLAAQRSAAMN